MYPSSALYAHESFDAGSYPEEGRILLKLYRNLFASVIGKRIFHISMDGRKVIYEARLDRET
jgi:hypothetical protein